MTSQLSWNVLGFFVFCFHMPRICGGAGGALTSFRRHKTRFWRWNKYSYWLRRISASCKSFYSQWFLLSICLAIYPSHCSLLEGKLAELRPWRRVDGSGGMTVQDNSDDKSLTGWKNLSHRSGAVTRAGSPLARTFTGAYSMPMTCVFEQWKLKIEIAFAFKQSIP